MGTQTYQRLVLALDQAKADYLFWQEMIESEEPIGQALLDACMWRWEAEETMRAIDRLAEFLLEDDEATALRGLFDNFPARAVA